MANQTFEFWNKQKVELSAEGVLSWRQLLKFEVALGSVRSCVVKARTFTELYQLELVLDGGGRGKTRILSAIAGDPAFEQLVWTLRQRLSPGAAFTDGVYAPITDFQTVRRYDVGARVMGRTLPRWGFLLLLYLLGFMVVPLLLAVWIQVAGRYRMTTDAVGLTVVRLLKRQVPWTEMRSVEAVRVVQYQNGFRSGTKLRLHLHHSGGQLKLSMNPVEGEQLLRELAARHIPISMNG
ncbi:MAG TPA: hypothetical protein VK745_28070 [Polyangiaceae bacterium]|jgi:hypothetical protein|nr:hypothetical protein [Polyangiaceae bacterium]